VNRILATLSFLPLAALVVVAIRSVASNRASAGEFQLIKEAEMPAGFPEPAPVGQIVVKQYPAYRRASASGVAEFWTLFRHIKQNDIQMTAPVEMDYGDPRTGGSRERSMSFLYERPGQGAVGRQGNVEVIDVPATKVISIGCRGSQTSAAVADARERLMKYLAEDRGRYTIAGPMRVMGYNSPFVPRDRNYFEVQIPVKDSKPG
jgi:hypothetical protein